MTDTTSCPVLAKSLEPFAAVEAAVACCWLCPLTVAAADAAADFGLVEATFACSWLGGVGWGLALLGAASSAC